METSQFILTKKFKVTSTPSAGKVMLTVFWDSQGVLLDHFRKRGKNVDSASHCEVLLKLLDEVRIRRSGQQARRVLLHHEPIQPKQARRELKNYSGNFLTIRPTARTWPLLTSTSSVCYKNTLVAKVSLMMKRLERR
jgi:hypothetical protein